jgi:nucleotide-binding universal stress UspA family protein
VRDSLKGRNLTEIIIEYALLCDADMISIMNDLTDGAKQLWFGSYAQQMVNHSPIPVISFNVKEH